MIHIGQLIYVTRFLIIDKLLRTETLYPRFVISVSAAVGIDVQPEALCHRNRHGAETTGSS